MIQITMVQGDVLVDDRKNCYMQMARNGMRLDAKGNYLIVTTASSRAQLMVNGQSIKLDPSSYMHIHGARTWWERHKEVWAGNAKTILGRLWARVERGAASRQNAPNAATGVRG